jgi:hypothetical protein
VPKKSRYTEEQIVHALRAVNAGAKAMAVAPAADGKQKHGGCHGLLLCRACVAAQCGVHPDTFDRGIRRLLPVVDTGGHPRWSRASVEAFVQRREFSWPARAGRVEARPGTSTFEANRGGAAPPPRVLHTSDPELAEIRKRLTGRRRRARAKSTGGQV